MKKRMFYLIAVVGILIPVTIFGQDTLPNPPSGWLEIAGRLPELFGSFGGVYVLILAIIPLLLGLMNITEAKKSVKYALTVAVTAVLTLLARFFPFGFLYNANVVGVVLHGIALFVAQVLSYGAAKAALDAAAEKVNFWK